MGLTINVEKVLGAVAKKKKNATLVRERVLNDMAAVYTPDMTLREAVEFGYAMAEADEDVAAHLGNMTLAEVLGFDKSTTSKPRGRPLDKDLSQTLAADIVTLVGAANAPVTSAEIRQHLECDDTYFKSAWAIARRRLEKSGEGRKARWRVPQPHGESAAA